MKQRVNHARSKQKRKKLRLRNRNRAVYVRNAEQKLDAGLDVTAAEMQQVNLKRLTTEFEHMRRACRMGPNTPNQRQRRKAWRQSPQLRKRQSQRK